MFYMEKSVEQLFELDVLLCFVPEPAKRSKQKIGKEKEILFPDHCLTLGSNLLLTS